MVSTTATSPAPAPAGGRLLLVDGHSMAFRAFYALPVDSFTTSTGQTTNAVHGFVSMFLSLLETFARLGLRTLADLASLPRKDVAARFGPMGEQLHRLAAGTHHEAPAMTRPAQDIVVTSPLDPPV